MKKLYFAIAAVMVLATAQAQTRLATTTFQKAKQPALEKDIPFPEKTVSRAIDAQLQKQGYKGKDANGFLTFKGVRLAELGSEAYDLYFKTDRKSRNEKDATTVTLMVSTGFEKFVDENTDAALIAKAKGYLSGFTPMVAAYDLELQIAEQESVAAKAAKTLANLEEDAFSLQKKKAKLDADIANNLSASTAQKATIEKEALILKTLKEKRQK